MFRRKVKKPEKPTFPVDIEGFGYVIKPDGSIRSKEEGKRFLPSFYASYNFEVIPKDRPYNEARYEAFIALIGDEVEKRLQQEPLCFQKTIIPKGAKESDPHTYIYMTPNALTTTDKLLLLIPGNNTRIGQWSRRVMCDENIMSGSMIEVATMAKDRGYETIIFNPNGIYWYNNKAWEAPPLKNIDFITVPENDSPEAHCHYVFEHFVRNTKATKMAAIALGWGGHCFTEILNKNFDFLKDRMQAVAMADSVHSRDLHAVNWAVSQQPRGDIVTDTRFGCEVLSSNCEIADFTLPSSIKEIVKFIDIKMGDIEPEIEDNDDQEEEPQLTKEEEAELKEHLSILSVG
ncbi:Arb2 domain-containing protein [Phycomyces nitens]|nr:Arb2 domain-containing protein [Phycomyces nitens]